MRRQQQYDDDNDIECHLASVTESWFDKKTGPVYRDDITGEILDREQVEIARRTELEYFRQMGVYEKVPMKQCTDATQKKPIGVRWVDVVKKDGTHRSRLVAKEIRKHASPELFAATPPIESIKLLLAITATDRSNVMLHLDVSRAYFYASALRDIFIELPAEDREYDQDGRPLVGKLRQAMYGTRDAAQAWQKEYQSTLRSLGFVSGQASPCQFYHPHTKVRAVVHGDDFLFAGKYEALKEVETAFAKKYRITNQWLGENHAHSLSILNRLVTWTSHGLEYEGDERHAHRLIEASEVENMAPLTSPCVKSNAEDGEPISDPSLVTKYRGMAARANFMGIDRMDVQFAAKEASRRMANPTAEDFEKIKRISRYLNGGRRRVFQVFPWGSSPTTIYAFSDSDWAGCKRSRKSTSGGVIYWGDALVKHWSSTQKSISLSTQESELYACTKALSESMGVKSLLKDFDFVADIVVSIDAKAVHDLAYRTGLGRARHVETSWLWIQQMLEQEKFTIRKIDGDQNPADLLTKPMDQAKIANLMAIAGLHVRIC